MTQSQVQKILKLAFSIRNMHDYLNNAAAQETS